MITRYAGYHSETMCRRCNTAQEKLPLLAILPRGKFLIWDFFTWTLRTPSNSGLPSPNITGGVSDGSANLFFSTQDNGLVKYDRTNFMTFTQGNSELPDNRLSSITTKTLVGDLWIGSQAGLVFFSAAGSWTTTNTSNSSIRSNNVTVLHLDRDNNIWLKAGGLSRYGGGTWTHYTDGNSDPLFATCNAVHVDANGLKWVATQGGGLISFE